MVDVWFSSMLRFAVLIRDKGVVHWSKSVIVFRSPDFTAARARALEIGRSMEKSYLGGDTEEVQWKLAAIETIDLLGDSITDAREVYSENEDLPEDARVTFDGEFHPERSVPGHSGV